jgi:DNA-binding PadR family transcriptional regulator
MSVRLGVLALVAQGPSYGYLLRAEFDRRTGTTWPLNVGQVYKTLETLERDGLVAKSARSDAAGHVFYEITDAGEAAVTTWLAGPDENHSTTAPSRNDVAIKIALATTLPGVDAMAVVRAQRASAIRSLQRLTRETGTAAPTTADELSRQLVSDAIVFEAETEVRWLDHVARRITQATAAGLTLDVPVDSDPPRRGRPSRTARPADQTSSASETAPKDDSHA